jgi:hypothetical protein
VSLVKRRSLAVVGIATLAVVAFLVSGGGVGSAYSLAATQSCFGGLDFPGTSGLKLDVAVGGSRSSPDIEVPSGGAMSVSFIHGGEANNRVDLWFYGSGQEANDGIGQVKEWRAQWNSGPSVDSDVLYHRGNVMLYWFAGPPVDVRDAVEACLK